MQLQLFGAGRFFKTAERLQFLTRVDLFSAVFARRGLSCLLFFFLLRRGTFNHCGRSKASIFEHHGWFLFQTAFSLRSEQNG